jgi:hypothetical protein
VTAPDARDELRGLLAEALRSAPYGYEEQADTLLPTVTAYADSLARVRAAEELVVLASRLISIDVEDPAVYEEIRALRDALAADDQPDGAR